MSGAGQTADLTKHGDVVVREFATQRRMHEQAMIAAAAVIAANQRMNEGKLAEIDRAELLIAALDVAVSDRLTALAKATGADQ